MDRGTWQATVCRASRSFYFNQQRIRVWSLQLCLTLCDPMDYSLPSSSVHGILQARILGELPFPSPGDLPNPGIKLRSPTLQADALPSEPLGKTSVWEG